MARTPSMTPDEALAAIGHPHPRGSSPKLFVTAANVHAVRKFLTAMGLPGAYVANMQYWALANCFNDPTNAEIGQHKAKAASAKIEDKDEDSDAGDDMPTPAPAPLPVPPHIEPRPNPFNDPPTPAPQSDNVQIQRIAKLLGELLATPQLDVGQVADIARTVVHAQFEDVLPGLIAKHSPRHSPSVTVKVHGIPQGETRIVEGHTHRLLPKVIKMVDLGIHVLLVGPAGSGKSSAAEQVAHALGLDFYMQPAATGAHDYLGYCDAYGAYHTTGFRQAFEHGGLLCAEELDGGHADVYLVLNAALANGHCYFPDSPKPVARHPNFRIVANANTFCMGADRIYVGRTQLDGATNDRFAMVQWDYDTALERKLAGNDAWVDRVQSLRRAAQEEKARIIISPRASIYGAKMLESGKFTTSEVEDCLIWKGADKELQRRIEARATA